MLATPEAADYDDNPPNPGDGEWCLVHEQSVVCDTVVPIRNIPAGNYRVTVDFLSNGSVTIIEQHTI
jgi:hypothetical protein